jgi:hypothetical protein
MYCSAVGCSETAHPSVQRVEMRSRSSSATFSPYHCNVMTAVLVGAGMSRFATR